MSATNVKHLLKKKRMLLVIAFIGLLITVLIVKLQPDMEHEVAQKIATPVNIVAVEEHRLRPSITGFGTVKPDLILRSMAEASGRITYLHPDLKKGAILMQGTIVATIDDKDYRLALKQAQADLLAAKASHKEMELTINNNALEIKLAQEKLAVRNKELQRLTQLRKSGTVSQSSLEQERQTMLAQQQEVQKLENQRTTLPSELAILEAKIDISQAQLQQSERDLARTQISLPFNARISSVSVEKDQFISKGANLFDAVGLEKIIINAQFPVDQFSQFAAEFDQQLFDISSMQSFLEMTRLLESLGLTATVEIAGAKFEKWQAKVERFSDNLDVQSRTIGVIVSVSGSYNQIKPGLKPPLLDGMYMQVTLKGKANNYLALPRFALHQQQAFKVSNDNTLERISLNNLLLQGELALIKPTEHGINAGDKLIVSDVFPAVQGMKVSPFADADVVKQLAVWLEEAK